MAAQVSSNDDNNLYDTTSDEIGASISDQMEMRHFKQSPSPKNA
jgi:hypothetical protein